MFQVDYMPLLKSLNTQTGLSFVEGEPVETLADLPLFRIEVRKFRTDDHAQAFVTGLEVVGSMNKIVFDWEEGAEKNNRLVLVGFLQDEVTPETPLEERISLVEFAPSKRDYNARVKGSERHLEESRQFSRKMQAEADDMMSPLATLGYRQTRTANNHVSVKGPDGYGVGISWGFNQDGIEVSTDLFELKHGSLDLSAEFDAYVATTSCQFESTLQTTLVIKGLQSKDDIPDAIERLRAVEEGLNAIRKKAYWDHFVKNTPMTKPRREFLKGADEGGIRCYINRANKRASAGGRDIGQTEIDTLVRRGWLEGTHPKLQISDLGRADAKLTSAAPKP
ncbi:hypothetical protein [Rhizobium sp. MHM7A]|uniref:hypothetical protein n=1 Tax=Rhizobium sp. MHM7A TaxID=2583233 RepID=UPI001105B147|nr:hypothetical protein [Rhizobium sp. MHM7A]TLX16274.1 hypothetical protein FFR93_02800 [Rhizobium sp. MHM7A]